jgi:hypothetical protein
VAGRGQGTLVDDRCLQTWRVQGWNSDHIRRIGDARDVKISNA